MKFKVLFILITFFYFNSSFADVLKPSVNIDPKQVVVIQLNALMKNDSPYKDRGIEQTWEFAHPNNQRMTGPLDLSLIHISEPRDTVTSRMPSSA